MVDFPSVPHYYESREEVNEMYTTGEKPGKGSYQCMVCGEIVVLDDNTDTLPPCPKCHNTTYRKVS